MKVYSFPHGGISFDDPTAPSRTQSVLSFLPGLAIIPLVAHNGSPSFPVVAENDGIPEGQLVARRQGAGSANIYSPVPGRVVQNITWNFARNVLCNAMAIRMEGSFSKLGKEEAVYDWRDLSPFMLREIIADYGIVEMDGTGIPITDVISLYHKAKEPVSLVIRCVFDDPWLVSDYVLCNERIDDLCRGVIMAARAAQAAKIVFAISAPERKLGNELLKKMHDYGVEYNDEAALSAELILVGARYPQRNKRELEMVLRQCEKKEKRAFGEALYMGVSTICAIYDAVVYRRAILDRYVAVGGSAVRRPRVLKARIGSRLAQVFEECGGFKAKPKRTAIGSPLLGRPVFSMDEPVTPSTYAVFATADEKFGFNGNPRVLDLRKQNRLNENIEKPLSYRSSYAQATNCIGCGECRAVCPVGIDPEDIYKLILSDKSTQSTGVLALRCHGCGCCEAVCPSRLPLSRIITGPMNGDS